jgi:dipeptidyl aminopeptidase/acylaminoacyl peptidase
MSSSAKQPISFEDLYKAQLVNDPAIAPDGTSVLFTVREILRDDDAYHTRIWSVSTDGTNAKPIGPEGANSSHPRWAPDGKSFAFLSNSSGSNQIWSQSGTDSSPEPVTSLDSGVRQFTWSPDGTKIAFLSTTQGPQREKFVANSRVRTITRLAYKYDGLGWWNGTYTHLFVLDLSSGNVSQISSGEFDVSAPAWSPDNTTIAFVGNTSPEADYTSDRHVYTVSLDGSEPKQVTPPQGPLASPQWSPDGNWISFRGQDHKYDYSGNQKIWIIRPDGSDLKDLTRGWDNHAGNSLTSDMTPWGSSSASPQWHADGKSLLFIATIGGAADLYRVGTDGSDPEPVLTGEQNVIEFEYSPENDRIVAVIDTVHALSDLFAVASDGSGSQQLTSFNTWLNERNLPEVERVEFPGDEGTPIEGWIMKPVNFDPTKTYPLVLQIHGGSHLTYGWTFCHEFHVLASAGYAVMFTNPRGSQGYGQEFSACVRHDWCGQEFRDLIKGTEWAASLDYIDEARLGVTGGSFGGLLTNWIVAHSDLFAAAVTDRCTSNRYSNWGTKDFGWLNGTWQEPGNPWDSTDFYMDRSPIQYVEQINTPLLIVHSDEDHRCAIEQAEQLFTAMKWLKKDVEWVLFLGESHGLSRYGTPSNRQERLQRIAEWFDKYLK